MKNYHQGPDWLPGEILTTGSRNYKVKLSNGTVVRRHVDQMRDCSVSSVDMPTQDQGSHDTDLDDFQSASENESPLESTETDGTSAIPALHRSARCRQPPNRFNPATS